MIWKSDIDFENDLIHISRTKDRFGPRSAKTKNSYRTFPMGKNIKNLLLVYKEWYEQTMALYHFRNPIGYVFVTYAGDPLGKRLKKTKFKHLT